jgi:ABC-type glycerol-3-phosphate transport system permease component
MVATPSDAPAIPTPLRTRIGQPLAYTLIYLVLILWSGLSLFCLLWVLANSFKTNQELFANAWALPANLQWANYLKAWQKTHMDRFLLNSVAVCVGAVTLTAALAAMSSYVLARFSFIGRRPILVILLAGLAIPMQLITIPLFLLFTQWGLINSLPALTLVYVAISLPFSIFVLTGFFRTVPRELEEAAVLDGANEYQVFWQIMLPLVRPGLVTVSIFNFLNIWNEYLLALMLLNKPENMTVPMGLYFLRVTQGAASDWVSMIAGLVIVLTPTFIFFLIFQNRIAGGLTVGALKG